MTVKPRNRRNPLALGNDATLYRVCAKLGANLQQSAPIAQDHGLDMAVFGTPPG